LGWGETGAQSLFIPAFFRFTAPVCRFTGKSLSATAQRLLFAAKIIQPASPMLYTTDGLLLILKHI